MFFRLYFLFRCKFNYSKFTDAYSKKICQQYDFYPGFRFILKSKFVNNPEKAVFTLFSITVFLAAYILRIFEMRYAKY